MNCVYGDELLVQEDAVKQLGVHLDKGISFEKHIITELLKSGNQKLHGLMRVAKYLTEDKLKLTMCTFIESLFNYCPLVWMCHSRILENKINKLHERALRVVYKNKELAFEQLLEKSKHFSIHERNLQKLALEMYKVKNELSPAPVCEIFTTDPSERKDFILPRVRTVKYGLETIRYRGPKTWGLVPEEIKMSTSLLEFQHKIKQWKPLGCTCRLCKVFIRNVGYL